MRQLFVGNCIFLKRAPLYGALSKIYNLLALLRILLNLYRNNKKVNIVTCLTNFLLSNNYNIP